MLQTRLYFDPPRLVLSGIKFAEVAMVIIRKNPALHFDSQPKENTPKHCVRNRNWLLRLANKNTLKTFISTVISLNPMWKIQLHMRDFSMIVKITCQGRNNREDVIYCPSSFIRLSLSDLLEKSTSVGLGQNVIKPH